MSPDETQSLLDIVQLLVMESMFMKAQEFEERCRRRAIKAREEAELAKSDRLHFQLRVQELREKFLTKAATI